MAQVTMTGQEYAAYLAYERQYHQLHDAILDAWRADLTEETFEHTGIAGKTHPPIKWPEFLIGDVARCYASQFTHAPEEVQRALVRLGLCTCDIPGSGFLTYGDIHFLDYDPGAKALWERIEKQLWQEEEAAQREETDNE